MGNFIKSLEKLFERCSFTKEKKLISRNVLHLWSNIGESRPYLVAEYSDFHMMALCSKFQMEHYQRFQFRLNQPLILRAI